MTKGRATTEFMIEHWITESELVIKVHAPVESEDVFAELSYANGTVALGKAVAEIGKLATPETAREKRVKAYAQDLVAEGLNEERALELADQHIK